MFISITFYTSPLQLKLLLSMKCYFKNIAYVKEGDLVDVDVTL